MRLRRNAPMPRILLILFVCAALFFIPRYLGLAGDCSGGGVPIQPGFLLTAPSPLTVAESQLYSSNALLIRLSDGAVVYAKENNLRTYPASLTKMMTVITFVENYAEEGESAHQMLERLKLETYTMPPEIFPMLEQRHASVAGLEAGETVSLLDLLYACHLPSGADGSLGLSISLAGSEAGFVDLMNQKAAELGMTNSHFANATGLHDPQHYTTADDMALLMEHALQNEIFRTIFTASQYKIAPTPQHPDGMTLHSTLSKKMADPQANRTTVLGGKTGYTEEAGLCLASLAKKGSQEYILITMGAPGNNRSPQYNMEDARTLYGAL